MKTINFKLGLSILTFALLMSCSDDSNDNETNEVISDEEIAEIVINSVSDDTEGMVTQVEKSAEMSKEPTLNCSESDSASFSSSSEVGSSITYSTSYNWNWIYNCIEEVPDNFAYTFSGNSSYETSRMASDDTDNYEIIVSNLDPSQENFVINENFNREGTQVSKIQNQYTFTSSVVLSSSDINVNKSTGKIVSGAVAVQITATSTSGNSTQRAGTLTFNGNNSATLELLNGSIYNFSW